MANSKNSKNKERSGLIKGIVCFVVGAALLVGAFFGGAAWGKTTVEQPKDDVKQEQPSGGLVVGDGEGNGVRLIAAKIVRADFAAYGVSEQSESAYTLTATVTPNDADDKTVDWSVTFNNSTSSWANGKTVTDYVIITPTTDGALTATAECKAAFGEQIVITVTARANKEAQATCTVDYQRKLEYTNFKAVALDSSTSTLTLTHNNNSTVNWNWLTTLDPYDWDRYSNEYEDCFGSVYTINDTVTSHSIEVKASAALQAALDKVTITVTNSSSDRAKYKKSYTFSGTSYDANKKFLRLSQFSLMGSREYSRDGIFYAWVDSYDDDGSEIDTYSARYYTAMKGALTSCSVDFEITVKTTLASGGTYTKTHNVNVADSSLRILVNGISMDKTGLIY